MMWFVVTETGIQKSCREGMGMILWDVENLWESPTGEQERFMWLGVRVKKVKWAILLLEFRRGAHLPS